MSCPLCSPHAYEIQQTDLWTVVLNDDQGYLGRCYFALNRHETDVCNLSELELMSLWKSMGAVKATLDQLWQPDHYNYVFLMNVQPHLHAHIIPRYDKERHIENVVFYDGRLGSHYSLENIHVPPGFVLEAITRQIRKVLASEKLGEA